MVGAAEEAEQIGRELLVEINEELNALLPVGFAVKGFPRSWAKAGKESLARES
jgi:hypothetical protein